MDVTILGVVGVTAIVDDRGTGQAGAAIENATGFQSSPTGLNVGPVARGHMIHIAVEATDIPVQIDELPGRNYLIIECGKTILDTDIVQGSPGNLGLGNTSIDINGVIVN
jgi:hypothetical protein